MIHHRMAEALENGRQQPIDLFEYLAGRRPETRMDARDRYPR